MKIVLVIAALTALTFGLKAHPDTQASQPISSQTLTGGTHVLGNDTFAAFSLPQSTAVKLETIRVTGQSFTFELAGPPFDKTLTVGIHPKTSRTLFQIAFQTNRNFVIGEAAVHLRLGFDNQTLEFGGVVLKNFGKTKQITDFKTLGFSYAGREANAAWRVAANARIEQIRKSDFKVKIMDANNQPVSGASVHLEMNKHAFAFGTAVSAQVLKVNPTYKAKILKLYNRAVLANDLKWPDWEFRNKQNALDALKFFKDNGISARGHTLI
jgi:hypothetical protein